MKLKKIIITIFILSLFFPIRHVFFTNSAYLTGAYSDFTSFSLYLSDVLIFILAFLTFLPRGGIEFWSKIKDKGSPVLRSFSEGGGILIIWLILAFLWHFQSNIGLNWYFLLKYAELIVAYGTITVLFKEKTYKSLFLWTFVGFSIIQSFLAIWQFIFQKSIGLKLLGEQVLSPSILGVAKIVSNGTTYIRGYGTFPHPNLLAAFLVTGILISIYLYLVANRKWQKVLLIISVFVNIFGLTVTFSRAGYLAFGIGLIIYIGYLIKSHYQINIQNLKYSIIFIVLSIFLAFIIFMPFLLSRATITDQATVERKVYNQIGLKIIKDKPVFGVGIGDSVLHMEQYSNQKLEPWQKQPIHNYFLLAAAEFGIPGALILLWIFLSHLWALWLKIKDKGLRMETTYYLLLVTILICFLILMQFDHYFYTLQQTQLLLWVILGIIATAKKSNTTPPLEKNY